MSIEPGGRNSVNAWEQTHFRQKPTGQKSGVLAQLQGLLNAWYYWTAPPELPSTATVTQRELVRRGRLASIILFAAILYCIFSAVTGFLNRNLITGVSFTFLIVAAFVLLTVNRRGHLTLVGIIFVALAQVGSFQIFFTPGGLALSDLPRLDTLIIQIILCIAFLPPIGAIVLSIVNCIYIWLILTYAQHAPSLAVVIASHQVNGLMIRPMILNILVAGVLYLWASSAEHAIARADRAESIAALEHTIAEQEHEIAEEKEGLERSIQLITETHRRIANGDESARVPLDDRNKLWPVAGMLNNLLSRLQQLRRESYELARTKQEAERLAAILRQARQEQRSGRIANSGTVLDMVTVELVNYGLLEPPSEVNRSKGNK
jgi:hypothetical protein